MVRHPWDVAAMLPGALTPRNLLDPRGRCNRRGLLVVSGALLGLEAVAGLVVLATGVAFDGPLALLIKLALLWTALAATARRLHDCGQSAWWIAAAAFATMIWCFALTLGIVVAQGPAAFALGSPWFVMALLGVMMPMLALVVWLHCAPGEATANRFGPVPGPAGFAASEDTVTGPAATDLPATA